MNLDVFDTNNYILSYYAIPTFIVSIISLVIVTYRLVREGFSFLSISFFLLGLTIFIWLFSFSWMYCATDKEVALWWIKAAYFGLPFLPTAVYNFSLVFLQIHRQYKEVVWFSFLLSALFSFIAVQTDFLISGVYKYRWGYYPEYGFLSIPYLMCFLGILLLSLYYHIREYRKALVGSIYKIRIKAFIVAFSIAYIGVFDYFAKFGINIYPFGYLPIVIFLIISSIAISRYRFVDITPAFASEKIIDTMNDVLLVLDSEGTIRLANKASTIFFNQFADDLTGKHITMVLNNSYFSSQFGSLIKSNLIHNFEISCNSEKLGERLLSVSISSIKDSKDYPLAYVFIAKDITKRTLAERALLKTKSDLNRKFGSNH